MLPNVESEIDERLLASTAYLEGREESCSANAIFCGEDVCNGLFNPCIEAVCRQISPS